MSTIDELQRRALVMRRVRVLVAGVVPLEMFLYVTPPGVTSRLHPLSASISVVAVLLGVTALSAAVHRRITDVDRLRTWAWAELAVDNVLSLWILYLFSFDQFSAIWTILVIVSLEGAFRGGRRGALLAWSLSAVAYTGIQVLAAHRFPDTAPLDPGSIIFRALVTGIVAMVAGQLASQLQEALER
ncbi:MAG: hypothetical protein ABIO67_09980, partial [Mycobacteriales bacterium]